MMRTKISVVLVLVLALPATSHAAPRANAPKPAKVLRDFSQLKKQTSRASALPSRARRASLTALERSRKAMRAKRHCDASSALVRYRRQVLRAGRRGRARRAALLLATRSARVRALVLASRPEGRACGGPATIDVDAAVRPNSTSLPEIGQSGPRPIARLTDAYGTAADFVENELLVVGSSTELRDILERQDGRLLHSVDLPGDGPDAHVIRIRARNVDADRVAGQLERLSRTRGTTTQVSSSDGLELLGAFAAEAQRRRGVVGLNFVGEGTTIASGSTAEDPNGPGGFDLAGSGWSPDPFRWTHMAAGTAQDVGVTAAWQLLARTGRLQPESVKLAVLDQGFSPAANGTDFGANPIAPFGGYEVPNATGCGRGNPCPWHGTGVHNAAMAAVDNGFGGAGPAGPIARPVAVATFYDSYSSILALAAAYDAGARIANMSYSGRTPAIATVSVLPFEAATIYFRARGMLIFAAAGNDDKNVDAEDCFIVCWEEAWHHPCENSGVICVGALGRNSRLRASYSNFGREDVDIWAPGTIIAGPDPSAPSGAQAISGTSEASPFTAGVAALGWAADPSASADAIERALIRNAPPGDGRAARRIVHALGFVTDLLPPVAAIVRPLSGQSFRRGEVVFFEVDVVDDGRGAPTSITWTAGGNLIGTGPVFSYRDLPVGNHTVRVEVRLGDGTVIDASVPITITNDPPSVTIDAPANGATVYQGQTITFRGSSRDENQPESGYHLRDDQVSWFLDGSGSAWATGHQASRNFAAVSPGMHTIRFRGSDGLSTAESTVTINVQPNPPGQNLPPSVAITAPADDTVYQATQFDSQRGKYFVDVAFATSASDPEGGPLTYDWENRWGPSSTFVQYPQTTSGPTLRLYHELGGCTATQHRIRVTVRDNANQTSSDTIDVFVAVSPC